MKQKKKSALFRWMSVCVLIFLIVGNSWVLKSVEKVEPVNVIAKNAEQITYETFSGEGEFGILGMNGNEEMDYFPEENNRPNTESQSNSNTEKLIQNGSPQKNNESQDDSKEEENQQEESEKQDGVSLQGDDAEDEEHESESGERAEKPENEREENGSLVKDDSGDEPSEEEGTGDDGSEEGIQGDNGSGVGDSQGDTDGTGEPGNPGTENEQREENQETQDEETIKDPDTGTEQDSDDGSQELDEGLVTDLQSQIVTPSDVENGILSFYAYYSNPKVDANIKVNYKHESETGNGTWLTASGRDYSTQLILGKNTIVIYYSDKNGQRNYATYTITYEAQKATEENKEVGFNPPVIETNLDTWKGEIKTQDFTFTVKAKTTDGEQIYSNHINVQLDGVTIQNPTGNSVYEYVLHFEKPLVNETEKHKITVLAWDDVGNSKLVCYEVTYRSVDEGQVNGQVRVVVDATTVDVGILGDEVVDIIQGKPASYTLLAALDRMGFEYEYAGTKTIGFYIRSISRGNAFRKAAMPSDLLTLVKRDGLELRTACGKNKLSEYDFTQGSGWLYCVNAGEYAGKGLSEWNLNDGDILYLRYTVAYGKDIGNSQDDYGKLKSYCGMWIDGGFVPLAHDYEQTKVDATENANGYIQYCCKNCKHTYQEVLP